MPDAEGVYRLHQPSGVDVVLLRVGGGARLVDVDPGGAVLLPGVGVACRRATSGRQSGFAYRFVRATRRRQRAATGAGRWSGLPIVRGASPPARGRQNVRERNPAGVWFIPASAGPPDWLNGLRSPGLVHPRVRRGYCTNDLLQYLDVRFIPARAGPLGSRRARPRSSPGSSPRSRGRRCTDGHLSGGAGFIPAHAGLLLRYRRPRSLWNHAIPGRSARIAVPFRETLPRLGGWQTTVRRRT